MKDNLHVKEWSKCNNIAEKYGKSRSDNMNVKHIEQLKELGFEWVRNGTA